MKNNTIYDVVAKLNKWNNEELKEIQRIIQESEENETVKRIITGVVNGILEARIVAEGVGC